MQTLVKNRALERLVQKEVVTVIGEILRDPELFLELSERSKKRIAASVRSKRLIPFSVIRKKYG